MKTWAMILLAAASLNASAALVPGIVCRAQCLEVDTYSQTIRFLGSQEAIATTKSKAWKKLGKKCGMDAILVEGHVFFSSNRSHTTDYWSSSTTIFRYRSISRYSSSQSRYSSEAGMTLEVKIATPKSSCEQELVEEEDLIDYYDGDQDVLG